MLLQKKEKDAYVSWYPSIIKMWFIHCIIKGNCMAKKKRVIKKKIRVVMDEFKKGELPIGKSDKKVSNPKQAIAIALSEAGIAKKRAKKKRKKKNK